MCVRERESERAIYLQQVVVRSRIGVFVSGVNSALSPVHIRLFPAVSVYTEH